MPILPFLDSFLQAAAAGASVGRVYTSNRVVGRRWNAAALLFIALDYSANYLYDCKDIYLTGALVFGALTVRTGLILGLRLDGDDRWRRLSRALISGGAWMVCAVMVIYNQYRTGGFDPKTISVLVKLSEGSIDTNGARYLAKHAIDPTVIALIGMGLGCLGEAMGDMVRTRRCIFGMGTLMTGFGIATHNWGQLVKNIFSDVTVTTISAIEFQDQPLTRWFPVSAPKMSAAVRRFRARYLTIPPDLFAKAEAAKTRFCGATLSKIWVPGPFQQQRPESQWGPPRLSFRDEPATGIRGHRRAATLQHEG